MTTLETIYEGKYDINHASYSRPINDELPCGIVTALRSFEYWHSLLPSMTICGDFIQTIWTVLIIDETYPVLE